jgi:hypothetical protein
LSPEKDYLVGETPAELALQVSGLLSSPGRRQALSRAGRDKAQETWSLEAVAGLQNRYCEEIAIS